MPDAIPGGPGAPRPIDGVTPRGVGGASAPQPAETFDVALARMERAQLDFSKHALKRIEQRGLDLDPQRMARLETAVGRAEAKGSKDSLILLDELAVVVNVRSRTVVTAMDEASRKEHVFTNIDSVVIAE
jgi:flagellar operon protein